MTERTPTIYFIRHGQTDWNAAHRLQGQTDIPLNARGRSQATRNGGVLAELIDDPTTFQFVASPLSRTRETMSRVRAAMGLDPNAYAMDDSLKEIAFGAWEGRSWPELEIEEPDLIAARATDTFNFRPPDRAAGQAKEPAPKLSESYADLTVRIATWHATIATDTVVVSHGGVSRALRGHLLDLAPSKITELHVPQDKVMRLVGKDLDWI